MANAFRTLLRQEQGKQAAEKERKKTAITTITRIDIAINKACHPPHFTILEPFRKFETLKAHLCIAIHLSINWTKLDAFKICRRIRSRSLKGII